MVFHYPKVFQFNNRSEFKSDVIKLREIYNVEVRRTARKYQQQNISFFKPKGAQELHKPEKVSAISVKSLGIIVNNLCNTKSLVMGIKSKNTIELNVVKVDKSE